METVGHTCMQAEKACNVLGMLADTLLITFYLL